MIASDDNNPNFTGAHDPDARLAVQFYMKPVQNEFKTKAEGRPIFEEVEMVKITIPGNNLYNVEAYVAEDHKRRFPKQYAHFMNNRGAKEGSIVGTPLSHWPLLTPSQAEELRYFKFSVVEQIANASDQQIQAIGMLAGMTPYAFRERAQRFLSLAKDEAQTNSTAEALKAAEDRAAKAEQAAADNAKALALIQEQMQAFMASKRPGRKPKAKVTEEV